MFKKEESVQVIMSTRIGPRLIRVPDTEEKGPEFYEKDKGSAQIHGQIFEYKFCALSFLRAKNKGFKFKLASNVKGVGAFDDVVLEYLDDNCSKKHIFLQLKSKMKQKITMQKLLAEKGDFSLRKYYDSFIQVENNFNCSEELIKMDGRADESLFIIYTNTDVRQDLKSYIVIDFSEEEFLMTGGSVLQFIEEEHKAIYQHMQDLPKHREFLSRFRIIYSQADEKGMDYYIKRELQHSTKLPENELELAYMCYIDFVKDWWQNCNYFLQDTNCKEHDPIRKTTDKLRTTMIAKKLEQRKSDLDELSIKYKQSAITEIKQLIEPHKALLIFAPGRSTTLTAAKIHQILSATKHIILNLQQFARYKSEVMFAWESGFDVLVLESQRSTENLQEGFNDIHIFLKERDDKKKFIFISSGFGNIQQTSALRNTFSTDLTQAYDDWKFADIVTDTRMLLLEKNVYFHADEIKLGNIVRNYDVGMLNALCSDSISGLLENEKFSIGIPIEDTVEYYIDRTLLCNKDIKSRFPVQEETKPALNNDVCQEFQDISSNQEKELGRETSQRLTPSTLLEVEGRVIFVTDEPGMGKSTLLTHLARETRKSHPDIWIVRVNINNYTRILNELKTNNCDENGVIKLLTIAAQVKETDSLHLERRLFDYTCSSTGNMVVLIDGVDEVSPLYTEQVVQILGFLIKTKIKKIWVTSRNAIKGFPEQESQSQSYSFVPFSEMNQKCFLVKFWKEKYSDVKHDYLEYLAQRVVELSIKHLTVGDKNFIGIPMQCLLLAEMFEENLKHYSTAPTVELPEHINVVVLYHLYVEKKWDIYLSEKKFSDRTNVNAIIDDNELHKTFIENHTAAALVAILSTQQLEKLADKTIAKKARDFLENFEKGEEKTGLIINVIEERPVFQHRTLAEYFVARRLCKSISASKIFMRDHLFESGFSVVRSMVDRILTDNYPLHEAVINSSLMKVEKLLRRKESITQKDRGGRNPLHVAVSCRSPNLIKVLLEHGADVSSADTLLLLSPVDYAIRLDDWEMLSLLMEKRSDIREQVLNGTNRDRKENIACALRAAAQYGHNDLLNYLISEGSSVNVALPGDSSTLFHVAVRNRQTETIKILFQLGARTDCQDSFGRTPLHVAVETGNIEVIKCMVENQATVQIERELENIWNSERTETKGKFVNLPDVDGNTPLHLGVAAGNTNIVSYLISSGSDKNTCNVRGEYPLMVAARCGKNDIVELLMEGEVQCEEAQIGALREAIVAGYLDTTKLLLRLGSPVNKGENEKPIHVASQLGRKEIVILLLQYGAILTFPTDTGNTALHLASGAGHLNLVKSLVEVDRNGLNTLNFENETPLHLAARNGRDHLVTYFAESGCNINAPSANGATCLHVACENGHYTTVELLLKHGADVNAMNSVDQTPLHIAASRGKTKIVELLFLHNVNYSLQDKYSITALLAACINGHQDTVLFIVQHGGNIEDTDGKGNTIAHFAVANGNFDILKFLRQHNISLDVQNSDGDTPLLQAVREGRKRMVQYLVERNSDINIQGTDGTRPLDVAVLKGNMRITRFLLERNASSGISSTRIVAAARFGFVDLLQRFVAMGDDINLKADTGESPLHAACKSGQVATVQYLCEQGALLDMQDNNGNAAIHVAVSNDHLDVTRVLVEKGANLSAADAAGSTALHIAAKGGYLNIVQYLADSFAPIDIRNAKKETALLVAAAAGYEKIVSVLIEQGAGIGVRDIEGKTALDIATENAYGVIIQLLKGRAEGRIVVCSNSHTDIHSAADNLRFEHLQTPLYAGVCIDIGTEKLETDAATEDTLQSHPYRRTALHIAAIIGSLEEVQRIVEAGIALDYCDTFGRTALWGAAKMGHKNVIRFLLENGSCRNIPDCEGFTPIAIAAKEGQWKAVDEFLEHDPTVLPREEECLNSQLHKASESADLETLHIILKSCINVDTTNEIGSTALHVATEFGHKEICRILLKSGASVNAADKNGKTPLILAAEIGGVEIVRELLASTTVAVVRELLNHGSIVDSTDAFGSTPLSAAASMGHFETVQLLLNHGANVDISDKVGRTPLLRAALEGHEEIVRELLNRGAKVDITDAFGSTPLSAAASMGHFKTVQLLLNHGANVDISDKVGRTPLLRAALEGHEEIVRELLNRGAKVGITDAFGSTPLSAAASRGHLETARELLQHGAGVDIADKDGRTPLIIAASEGHEEIVRELLNRGAKIDITDAFGSTPLSAAASRGHLETARELLQHGAGVDIADKDGRTPLIIAALEGHEEVVLELLNHGARVDITDAHGNTLLDAAALNKARGRKKLIRQLVLRAREQASHTDEDLELTFDNIAANRAVSVSSYGQKAAKRPQYAAAVSVTLGAFALGNVLGWNFATLNGKNYTYIDWKWVDNIMLLGAALAVVPVGYLIDRIGRKDTMLGLVLPFTAGWVFIALGDETAALYMVGRFITGMMGGAFSLTAPAYTSEIAEKEIRGSLGSCFQLMVTIGSCFVYAVGSVTSVFVLSIICGIVPLLFGVIFWFMPETPLHYLQKGQTDRAQTSLQWLRGKHYDVNNELREIEATIDNAAAQRVSFLEAFKTTEAKKGLMVAFGLMIFQQFCGINFIIWNAAVHFSTAASGHTQSTVLIIVGVIQVVFTFISTLVVDCLGRRLLLMMSGSVMTICMLLFAVYAYFSFWRIYDTSSLNWFPLTSLCVYIAAFSLGYGTVPWMMVGELFAPHIKVFASSLACSLNWTLAYLVTRYAEDIVLLFDYHLIWIFALISAIGTVFIFFIVPETKGKTLDEIQRELGRTAEGPSAATVDDQHF